MFLWSARGIFPSKSDGIKLSFWDLLSPIFLLGFVPFPLAPPLQLVLLSSDSASLVEEKQEPVVKDIKNVISRRLLTTGKTCGSLGHDCPAQQSLSAPKIMAFSCLNTVTDELIAYLMTVVVRYDCWV